MIAGGGALSVTRRARSLRSGTLVSRATGSRVRGSGVLCLEDTLTSKHSSLFHRAACTELGGGPRQNQALIASSTHFQQEQRS
jgi:hypothetical protein